MVWLAWLAGAADVGGTWTGPDLSMTFQPDGAGGWTGTVAYGGGTWPMSAQDQGNAVVGMAAVQGEWVAFQATPSGGALSVVTADARFTLTRQGGGSTPAPAVPQDVLARGAYAALSTDAAKAFHEALVFCLTYAGVKDAGSQVSESAVIEGLKQSFAKLGPEEQAAIANARAIWTDTKARWASMPQAQQQEFAVAVLELAFGEQATKRTGAPTSGRASGTGGLPSLDVPNPAQGCWASAGCVDYDAGSGTYTFEE